MKKIAIIFAAFAALACVSCNEQATPNVQIEKTLIALTDSTSFLNADWSVDWSDGANLTVYTTDTGTATFTKALYNYTSDNTFKLSTESPDTDDVTTDWYVC